MKTFVSVSLFWSFAGFQGVCAQEVAQQHHVESLSTLSFARSTTCIELKWPSRFGGQYQVEHSSDCKSWVPISSVTGAFGLTTFQDKDAARLQSLLGFYRVVSVEEGSTLALDYTFPTALVVEDIGSLHGILMSPSGELLFVVNEQEELVQFSVEGAFLGRRKISGKGPITGLAAVSENEILLVREDGEVVRYDWMADSAEIGGQFSDGNYQALAYRMEGGEIVGLTSTGSLVYLNGNTPRVELRQIDGLQSAEFTGMHAGTEAFYVTAKLDGEVCVLEISFEGKLLTAWGLGGNPTGVTVREETPTGPLLLTSNDDADSTVTQYEPEQELSGVDIAPPELVAEFSLGEEFSPQPSGVTYSATDNRLYFISDFSRVSTCAPDGTDVQLSFDIGGLVQGTFESIAVDENGELRIVASDEITPTRVEVFDKTGNHLRTEAFPAAQENQVVEGYAIDPVSGDRWWVNNSDEESKFLYRQPNSGGEVQSYPLPEEFDDMAIVGLEVIDSFAIFVTDERAGEEGALAGLIVVWEWDEGEEEARFTVAVPAEEEGDFVGVPAPSGVAFNPETGRVYVTADTDDALVFVFDLGLN